tara:strand:- start:11890 stop:13170 length:1281 start_codon:yes stop_codon:yes gene_type:complete
MKNTPSENLEFWGKEYLSEKIISNDVDSLHLFIIWEKSREKFEKKILQDLQDNFQICAVYEFRWKKENFLINLKRFYERTDKEMQQKIDLVGDGTFLVILVSDKQPILRELVTPTEKDVVNTKVIDLKMKYRNWIGEKFSVHSSISHNETNHDVTVLFGKNIDDLKSDLPTTWDGKFQNIELEPLGTNGWRSINELFYFLNGSVNYVILRNFDGIEKFEFNDIDILSEDEKIRYLLDGNFSLYGDNISTMELTIDNKPVKFDFRYLKNQNYVDEKWLKNILKRREFHPSGFYIPCNEDYFYSLLHHAIVHKGIISDKKQELLNNLSNDIGLDSINHNMFSDHDKSKHLLKNYMKQMGYRDSKSFTYRIRHNQLMRLTKVSIFILQKQGTGHLFELFVHKIKTTLTNTSEAITKGKIIDQTDYDLKK